MRLAMTELDLLEAWTECRGNAPVEVGVAVLARSMSEAERADVGSWSLARRNAALIELRMSVWGRELEGIVECPVCDGGIEFTLDLEPIVADQPAAPTEIHVETARGSLTARLPTDADLAAVALIADSDEARRVLARRCLVATSSGSEALDDDAIEAMDARMAEVDGVGATRLSLHCDECGHTWDEPVDLGRFIAEEMQCAARRVVAEVHTLASAYGWTERVVLAIPPERRRAYLELLEG
jgi:hypothetical protein